MKGKSMKKFLAVLFLFGVAGLVTTFSVVRADNPIPISEQLGLRPIDPTPITVAFGNPDAPAIHSHNTIEPKDWQLTNAEFSSDRVLELAANGTALSPFFPIQPGCYYFQIDQKTVPAGRVHVTVGNAAFGFFQDTMYANRNPDWMTFSHYFRIPETENQMQCKIQSRPSDPYTENRPAVHVKNLKLLPAINGTVDDKNEAA